MPSKGPQIICKQILASERQLVSLRLLQALYCAIYSDLFNRPLDVSLDKILSRLLPTLVVGVDLLTVLLEVGNPEVLQVASLLNLFSYGLLLLFGPLLGQLIVFQFCFQLFNFSFLLLELIVDQVQQPLVLSPEIEEQKCLLVHEILEKDFETELGWQVLLFRLEHFKEEVL